MTSGNLAEEPIVKGWEEVGRLAHIADAYLVHDREIFARYDDSVATCAAAARAWCAARAATRRSRWPCRGALPQVLACGAELKNTFCLTRDANAFLSQHIGDLENLETLEHFETSIELYKRSFGLQPEVVALRPASRVPGHQVRAGAAAGEAGRAASPRPRGGLHGRARARRRPSSA